jgi:tetratricopeptide (TPR) repeat protein
MMRYVPNDKYTIAWFKLAECVAKGEKEKAFGVYRLLMHSIEDQAYAFQLEGDLLGAFQDERAAEKYAYAAQTYFYNKRYKESADLYEELIFLVPDNQRYLTQWIDIYISHKNINLFLSKLHKIIDILVQKNMTNHLLALSYALEDKVSVEIFQEVLSKIIIYCIQLLSHETEIIFQLIKRAFDYLLTNDDSQIKKILHALEQADSRWHKKACEYINKLS